MTDEGMPMWVCELGLVPYVEAFELQRRLCERRQREEVPDTLLLLEHPPTYTRGRRSGAAELLYDEDFYRERGVEVLETDRGGRVTYHGPGQLVGYPIMRTYDIGAHLRAIESALIAALARGGVSARSRCAEGPDYTGVWVGPRKIASIGVHVSRGVTTHGFAVNVDNALEPFSWVVACGLHDVQMTSLQAELGAGAVPGVQAFTAIVAEEFARAHGRRVQPVAPERVAAAELVA
jgi:lipoyl(octanoyl) transferase